MKDKFRHLPVALTILALSALGSQLSTCFAQGSLTPPGAPAPTMKTLDQVEARTIVNSANTPGDSLDSFIISQPGSYYLTTNLTGVSGKNGIEITTNNVTLDLNGFAMQGVPGSINGIVIPNAATNITLRNGTLSSWGSDGVASTSQSGINLVCERLDVSSCLLGINLRGPNVVRDCNCGTNLGTGIVCGSGGLVSGCNASANTGNGIEVFNNCTVKDCTVNGNGNGLGNGIFVPGNNCQITGNTCCGNGGNGIFIVGGQNRIDNNLAGNDGSFGIAPSNINVTNSITRNSSPGLGYGNTSGNSDYAPIQTPNTATSPWANFQ